jgi:hypothetical protein
MQKEIFQIVPIRGQVCVVSVSYKNTLIPLVQQVPNSLSEFVQKSKYSEEPCLLIFYKGSHSLIDISQKHGDTETRSEKTFFSVLL